MLQFQQGVSGVQKYSQMQDDNAWFRATNLETAKGIMGENANWEGVDLLASADFGALAEHAKGGNNPLLKGAGISKEQAEQQMNAQMQRYFDAAAGGNSELTDLLGKHGGNWKSMLQKEGQRSIKGVGGEQTTVENLMAGIMVSADRSFKVNSTYAENQQKIRVLTGKEGTQKGGPTMHGDHAHTMLAANNKMDMMLNSHLPKAMEKINESLFGKTVKDEHGRETFEKGLMNKMLEMDPKKFENADKFFQLVTEWANKLGGITNTAVENAERIKRAIEKQEKNQSSIDHEAGRPYG
jgi:hypothetical protein